MDYRAGERIIALCSSQADAEFIAHARTDIPALVAALRAEREEVTRLREALGEVVDLRHDRDAAIARAEAAEAEVRELRAARATSRLDLLTARAEAAEAAIAAVRALHQPRLIEYTPTANGPEDAVYECRECQQPGTAAVYPCATIRALDTGATT
jgi:predicted mannosyl-3-phosphoglycerate phosphatase (HAD superfamily)